MFGLKETYLGLKFFTDAARENPALAKRIVFDAAKDTAYGALAVLSLLAFKEMVFDMGFARMAAETGNNQLSNSMALPVMRELIDLSSELIHDPSTATVAAVVTHAVLASAPVLAFQRLFPGSKSD
jgi:predicted amino acid dehydrogenase